MTRRLLPALALLLSACGPWMTEGDMYWLHRAGADMPVYVRGNVDSGVFLVTVHGGPGHDGLGMALSPGMQRLEDDVAIVYWDQRASGMSQGNPSSDTFTVADFVADTDAVLSLVQQAYDVDALMVYGHSWGGDLVLATMLDGQQAAQVDAWVVSAGTDDERSAVAESRLWAIDRAQELVDDGVDAQWWSAALDWYEANPVLDPSTNIHWDYVSRMGGYYWEESTYEPPDYLELAFASPFTMGIYENASHSHRLSVALLDDFDLTDRMHELTAPTLVIAGEHDGSVPVPVSQAVYDHLGTDPVDKELYIFDGVAHVPRDEATDEWVPLMQAWIERWTP